VANEDRVPGSDAAVVAAWEAARAEHPTLELDRDRFAAHVRELDVSRYPGDLYLAAACLAGNTAAIDTFERDVLTSARGAIAAIDARPEFVDEVLQKLRANLMVGADPRLAHYAGRGPLRAWIGVAAARTALMERRARKPDREVPLDDDEWSGSLASISTNNPELELLKRTYADAFGGALRDAVKTLDSRLRSVLRMSYVDALSIDQIGAVYAVHRATAARWIQRACDEVFAQTRTLLEQRLNLTGTELDRMTALVQSQLDVSLSQLLVTKP
jgi:RNA polymerase sigma-70 factor (ECF subfamily)